MELAENFSQRITFGKANHMLRYLRRAFSWGVRFGLCKTNPAKGVKQAKERARNGMPSRQAFLAAVTYARKHGAITAHAGGSVAPYLWAVMVIIYACRLRGIEAATLSDANHGKEGVIANRRKGSLDNIMKWSPALQSAVDALLEIRAAAWKRHKLDNVIPIRPEDRPLVVSESGRELNKSSLETAWQRLMDRMIADGKLAEEDRFTLHGIKHRALTDSKDKDAAGHKTEAMRRHYDHELKEFDAAEWPEFSGLFSGAVAEASVSN